MKVTYEVGDPVTYSLAAVHTQGMAMWWKGQTYRDYAHDCLWHAEQAKTPERRAKLVELAHFWVRVAQAVDAERTTGVTHATNRGGPPCRRESVVPPCRCPDAPPR